MVAVTPAWLLAAVLAMPVYKDDRSAELADLKRQQLELVAAAVHEAANVTRWPGDKRELEALLIVVGRFESGFALRISAGELKPWEGDPGKDGQPRSVSNWQLQKAATSSAEAWEAARTDVRVAAREAARALARSRFMCRSLEAKRDWVAMTLSSYAGRHCVGSFKGLTERVSAYRRIVR